MALRASYAVAERPNAFLGLISPPPMQVEFPKFSGTLAHLFTCVRDRKIDLKEVPLLPVCEAYFLYLLGQEHPDLDESASALAALSYLLERKAWLLLPLPETAAPDEEPLVLSDRNPHDFFDVMEFLREAHEERGALHFRSYGGGPDPYELPYQVEEIGIEALVEAFRKVVTKTTPVPAPDVTRVGRSLLEEMRRVLLRVSSAWKDFEQLLEEQFTKEDAVYAFLSLLELIRLQQVQARVAHGLVEFSRA